MRKPLIRFNEVYRDAIQSLMGTNPSAQEMLDAHQNAHLSGVASIQTGGGTFFDSFALKGRNEWEEAEKLISHFAEKVVYQTALIRGDFLLGFKPYPFEVVDAFVREYARMGMNKLLNFHGLNDTRVLAGVAEAVHRAREEEGHDIVAQGTICIEANRNVTIDNCLKTAQELDALGHEGFYLKSASGRLDPDFVYNLVGRLIDTFGKQPIDLHAHSTYGDAPVCLMAGVEAAIENDHGIGLDLQHPALSGSTAHPNMLRMHSLIKDHPNKAVSDNVPDLDFEAIKADAASLQRLRFQYRDYESAYDHELLERMRAVRAPGGATSTLKSIPGLVENLSILMEQKNGEKPSWNDIQIAVYETQAKIDDALGQPTQVTPYAFNTTLQAAMSLVQELQGKEIFDVLIEQSQKYMAGGFGHVPESVDPELQAKALEELGLDAVEDYVPSLDRPDGELAEAEQRLMDAGIDEPDLRQKLSAAVLKSGADHVVKCARGENTPQTPPQMPDYASPTRNSASNSKLAGSWAKSVPKGIQHDTDSRIFEALGGIERLEHISQIALFLKQLDDGLNPFPEGLEWKQKDWHQKLTGELTEFINAIPAQLAQAKVKGYRPGFETILSQQWTLHKTEEILRDVIDHRGPGLFNHMMEAIRGPGQVHLYRNAQQGVTKLANQRGHWKAFFAEQAPLAGPTPPDFRK